jgi:hypothetical protein
MRLWTVGSGPTVVDYSGMRRHACVACVSVAPMFLVRIQRRVALSLYIGSRHAQ